MRQINGKLTVKIFTVTVPDLVDASIKIRTSNIDLTYGHSIDASFSTADGTCLLLPARCLLQMPAVDARRLQKISVDSFSLVDGSFSLQMVDASFSLLMPMIWQMPPSKCETSNIDLTYGYCHNKSDRQMKISSCSLSSIVQLHQIIRCAGHRRMTGYSLAQWLSQFS